MSKTLIALAVLITIPALSLAQSGLNPYAGQENREIKALSADEVQSYLDGKGMGLAKAAELNHYPGPKHVLELASQLRLSDEQVARTKEVFAKMQQEAKRLGKLIVDKERVLDSLFMSGQIDQSKLATTVKEISQLQGELRVVHLQAHLEMKQIFSKDQIAKYDELRGYGASKGADSHKHHHHEK